ncbi:MAG TPA: hypothetical protein H9823_10650 [Candidatus Rubneribacter avistercoris]|nr:hypothetical protein [Candidatus Rubneribacter avistercoris]
MRSDDPRRQSRLMVVRRLFKTLFVVPAPVAALCPFAIAVLMAWVFLSDNRHGPLAYAVYIASAWCLAALVVAAVRGRPARFVNGLLHRNERIAHIVDDGSRRCALGNAVSLVVDAAWAAGNLAYGARAASWWFVTLGVYYLLLLLMRAALLHDLRCGDDARTAAATRFCGVLIGALALVVSGFVTLVSHSQGGFAYPGIVIYAVAAYTFFSLGVSIAGIVSSRRCGRQSMFAVSGVNLSGALVSILTLEMAMMSLFGAREDPLLVLLANALTGAGVAVGNIAVGVALVRKSFRLEAAKAKGEAA